MEGYMKIHRMNKLMRWLMPKTLAITLFPAGIFSSRDLSDTDLRHEEIHWEQQKEMLCIFFYLWYIIEWLIKLPVYGRDAYWNISFEREAYDLEDWPEINRHHYGWIRYIHTNRFKT
jgi:hypothetical protein